MVTGLIDKESLLAMAAQRAASDRFFLASALAAYQAVHELDDTALAARLGCEPAATRRGRPPPAAATRSRTAGQSSQGTWA